MTEALKIRVCNLLPEFLANTLVIFGHLIAARTVAASFLKPLFNKVNYILVLIQGDFRFHNNAPFSFCSLIISRFSAFVCNLVTKVVFKII